ncbi:SAF domain-containing protein [Alkalibacillus haloalkaliphilus]|nr:SAF domain-containing protein [Alkalibacillus haloalkaliphilus]MDV2582912.1 SAF domain-containing protein [Alkalibacillus haloalkaliphilus]
METIYINDRPIGPNHQPFIIAELSGNHNQSLETGEVLDHDNINIIRPGYGLQPKYYDVLIGKKINQDVEKGTPTSWDMFS